MDSGSRFTKSDGSTVATDTIVRAIVGKYLPQSSEAVDLDSERKLLSIDVVDTLLMQEWNPVLEALYKVNPDLMVLLASLVYFGMRLERVISDNSLTYNTQDIYESTNNPSHTDASTVSVVTATQSNN
jgi:ABC-type Fe3+-hydroxamate transport system substrate-binding protein